jgi:hypothetical protein
MLSKLRSYRPSHGTVVAYLALFVALGGSSYAAVAITGRDVRDGSLTGRDIGNNSLTGRDIRGITGRDVRNNSLTGADVAKLRRADFVRGALTPTSNYVVKNDTVAPDGRGFTEVDCPSGQVVTGGGFDNIRAGHVVSSRPVPPAGSPAGWYIVIAGASPGDPYQVYAVCSG